MRRGRRRRICCLRREWEGLRRIFDGRCGGVGPLRGKEGGVWTGGPGSAEPGDGRRGRSQEGGESCRLCM